jgi:hypothetical protein
MKIFRKGSATPNRSNKAMAAKFAALSAGAALLLAPATAQAQSCFSLQAQRDANNLVMVGIAADYPKTHIALMACYSDPRSTQEESEICAAGTLLVSCLSMGQYYCNDLTTRWQRAIEAKIYLDWKIGDIC